MASTEMSRKDSLCGRRRMRGRPRLLLVALLQHVCTSDHDLFLLLGVHSWPDYKQMHPGGDNPDYGVRPAGYSMRIHYGQCDGMEAHRVEDATSNLFNDFPQDELFDGTPEQCAYVCANVRFQGTQGCTVFAVAIKVPGSGLIYTSTDPVLNFESGVSNFGGPRDGDENNVRRFCCFLHTGPVHLELSTGVDWRNNYLAFATHLGFRQPVYALPGDRSTHALFDRVADPRLTISARGGKVQATGAIGPCSRYGTGGIAGDDVMHRGWPVPQQDEVFDGHPQTCSNHCAATAGCTHFAVMTGGCDGIPTVYTDAISPAHPDRAPASWTPDYSLASADATAAAVLCCVLYANVQLHLSDVAVADPDNCYFKAWAHFQMRLEEGRNRPGIAVPLNQGKTFGFLPTSSHGATKSPKCAAHQELPAPSSTCWQDSGSTLQQQVEVDKRDVTYAAGDFDFAASPGATNVNQVATYVPGDTRVHLEAGSKVMTAPKVGSDVGFWYAKFKDGKAKYVSSFTLWPRSDCFTTDTTVGDPTQCTASSIKTINENLDGACVRLQLKGEAEPSGAAPVSPCDITVPAKGSDRSARIIKVNARVVGFKIVDAAARGGLQFAGITDINAATPSSEDVLPDSGVWFTTLWPVTVVRLRDLVEQGGATAEAYFPPTADEAVHHRLLNVQDRSWYKAELKNPVNLQWFYFADNYGDRLGLATDTISPSASSATTSRSTTWRSKIHRKRAYNLLDNCYHLGMPEDRRGTLGEQKNRIQITLHATSDNAGMVKVFALHEMDLTSVPPWDDAPHWVRGPESGLEVHRSDSSGAFTPRAASPKAVHNDILVGSFKGMRQALMEPGQKLNVRRMVSGTLDSDGAAVGANGYLGIVFVCTNYPQEEHKNNFFQDLLIQENVDETTLEVGTSLRYTTTLANNATKDLYNTFALFPMTQRKKYQATDYFGMYRGPAGEGGAARAGFYGILQWKADGPLTSSPLTSLGGPYGLEEDSTAFLQLNWRQHLAAVPGDQVAVKWTNGPLPVRLYLTFSKGFLGHVGFHEEHLWGGGGWTQEEIGIAPGSGKGMGRNKLKWRSPVSVWNSGTDATRVETIYSKVFAAGAVIRLHGNAPPSYSSEAGADPDVTNPFLVTLQVLGRFFMRGAQYPYTVQAEKHFSGNLGITANLGDFESFPLHDDVHRNHSRPLAVDFLEELEISLNWGSAKNNRKRPLMLVQLMRLRKYPTSMPEQHGMYESLVDKIAEDYVEFYPARHRAPYNKKSLRLGSHSVVRKAKKGDFFYFYLLLSKCGIERMTVNRLEVHPKGRVLPPTSVAMFATDSLPASTYPFSYKCMEGTQLVYGSSWGGSAVDEGGGLRGCNLEAAAAGMIQDEDDATGYYHQLNVDMCAQECRATQNCAVFLYAPIGSFRLTQSECWLYPPTAVPTKRHKDDAGAHLSIMCRLPTTTTTTTTTRTWRTFSPSQIVKGDVMESHEGGKFMYVATVEGFKSCGCDFVCYPAADRDTTGWKYFSGAEGGDPMNKMLDTCSNFCNDPAHGSVSNAEMSNNAARFGGLAPYVFLAVSANWCSCTSSLTLLQKDPGDWERDGSCRNSIWMKIYDEGCPGFYTEVVRSGTAGTYLITNPPAGADTQIECDGEAACAAACAAKCDADCDCVGIETNGVSCRLHFENIDEAAEVNKQPNANFVLCKRPRAS